jgi:hypothetical protein
VPPAGLTPDNAAAAQSAAVIGDASHFGNILSIFSAYPDQGVEFGISTEFAAIAVRISSLDAAIDANMSGMDISAARAPETDINPKNNIANIL